jgi:hypothetical protein
VAAGTYPGHLDVHEYAVSGRTVIRGAGPGATIIQGGIDVNFHASLELEGLGLRDHGDASAPETFVGVRLESSMVANSTAGPDLIAPDARPVSRGFNLIETLDPGTPLRTKDSDVVGLDPVLGPLQDNGGPTETDALLPGSPALGVIPRTARCREPDQRGAPRAVPCGIGAFEAPQRAGLFSKTPRGAAV